MSTRAGYKYRSKLKEIECPQCGLVSRRRERYCTTECYQAWIEENGVYVPDSDPTPQEIAAECLLIQATWSTTERNDRMRVDQRRIPFEIPRYAG